MKKTNKRVSAKALIAAFVLLAVLFSGMVYAALYHGKAVQFGTVRGAHAFGAARLMQGASSQYQARMYDDEEIVLRALDNGVLDAALVSVENALKLDAEIYEIRGVFSVTDLMVLSSEDTVLGMQSLSGRKLILPEKLRGSRGRGSSDPPCMRDLLSPRGESPRRTDGRRACGNGVGLLWGIDL